METEIKHTIVQMPDESRLEVNYYCDNTRVSEPQKATFTKLFIQLDDCLCSMLIEKEIGNDLHALEQLVVRKVINTKGHLC